MTSGRSVRFAILTRPIHTFSLIDQECVVYYANDVHLEKEWAVLLSGALRASLAGDSVWLILTSAADMPSVARHCSQKPFYDVRQ